MKEHASVESLTALFAFDIKLVDFTTMHECGASDGYFDREQGDSVFVGLQVTRANSQSDKVFKLCTVHKSKNFIIRQVCELGFVFIAMLYLDNQCRGILLLTPHDEVLIRSLPAFDKMKLLATRGERQAKKGGSLASALESCIFCGVRTAKKLRTNALSTKSAHSWPMRAFGSTPSFNWSR